MTRTLHRPALAALAATLLLAAPAAADPFFEPDEAPVDSVATLELDLAHGCFAGAGDDGGGHGDESDEQPTLEVAVEVPDEVDVVVPAEREGWELEVEQDDDGRVEVITWVAAEGTEEIAPALELEAVHRGEVGDEVAWPVFQGCEEQAYRWIATAEDEEGDPAPVVTLVEADPDAPPPEPEEVEEALAAVVDDPVAQDPQEDVEEEDPADEDAEELEEGAAGDDPGDEDGLPGWLLLVVVLAVLVVLGAVLALRSRGSSAPDGPAGDEGAA